LLKFIKELSKDHLQFAPTTNCYISTLIDDVTRISNQIEKSKPNAFDLVRDLESNQNASTTAINDSTRINCLGIVMEAKFGTHIALTKGFDPQQFNKNDLQHFKETLFNLEFMINKLVGMENDEDERIYLQIAKLNRLKVLLELSSRIVGRPFIEISESEMNMLESEANRFYCTYPLPGEEVLLKEHSNKSNQIKFRLPIKIIEENGDAIFDINDTYFIRPNEFLAIYLKKIIEYTKETTGLNVAYFICLFI
jgi:hypothetical protein